MSLQTEDAWQKLLKDVEIADQLKKSENNNLILHDLEIALKQVFPNNICLHAFGSRTMGVADQNSDLDIYLEIDSTGRDCVPQILYQRTIANALRISIFAWKPLSIHRSRCPLIKVEHKATGIRCDISFSHGDVIAQNNFVNYVFELQPIARYMVIYLRGVAKTTNLKKICRTHIIILMVIFYLQVSGNLPSIGQLQEHRKPSILKWITFYDKYSLLKFGMNKIDVEKSKINANLKKFFDFYAHFPFSRCAISPYLGKVVTKLELCNKLPFETRLKTWMDHGDDALWVQDFTQLDFNNAERISLAEVDEFKQMCKLNLEKFTN